jgi:hypothetical protein
MALWPLFLLSSISKSPIKYYFEYSRCGHPCDLLKEAMRDMQQLLKDPEKLAEISRATKPR